MFCALLMSRYQVSVYRTNGPLVMVSEKKIFKHFKKIDPFYRPDNQSNSPI